MIRSMTVTQLDPDARHQLIQDFENMCEENGLRVKFYAKPTTFGEIPEEISAEIAGFCDSFIILVEVDAVDADIANIFENEMLSVHDRFYKTKEIFEILWEYRRANSEERRIRYYRKSMMKNQYRHSPTIWRSYPIFKRNKAPPNLAMIDIICIH